MWACIEIAFYIKEGDWPPWFLATQIRKQVDLLICTGFYFTVTLKTILYKSKQENLNIFICVLYVLSLRLICIILHKLCTSFLMSISKLNKHYADT